MITSGRPKRSDVIDITEDGLSSSSSPRITQRLPTIKKSAATAITTATTTTTTTNSTNIRQGQPRILNKGVTTSGSSPGTSTSPTTKTTAVTTIPHEDNSHIEKRCENPDCAAPTLISLVPTRSTPQFIHDPTVVPEPILVNGYTTVFEVGGMMAKIGELSLIKGNDGKTRYKSDKPIYRIVPKSHAHIVNYVIIDAEGETLRKIKQNDPSTIKKLLESQKNSAEQLLEKLIGVKKGDTLPTLASVAPPPISYPPASSRSVVVTVPQKTHGKISSNNTAGMQKISSNNTRMQQVTTTTVVAAPAATTTITTTPLLLTPAAPPTITTPVISSVSSGVPQVAALAGTALPSTAPAQVQATATTLERMQSELRELRETVKLLTDQKRTLSTTTGSSVDENDPKKRKAS